MPEHFLAGDDELSCTRVEHLHLVPQGPHPAVHGHLLAACPWHSWRLRIVEELHPLLRRRALHGLSFLPVPSARDNWKRRRPRVLHMHQPPHQPGTLRDPDLPRRSWTTQLFLSEPVRYLAWA